MPDGFDPLRDEWFWGEPSTRAPQTRSPQIDPSRASPVAAAPVQRDGAEMVLRSEMLRASDLSRIAMHALSSSLTSFATSVMWSLPEVLAPISGHLFILPRRCGWRETADHRAQVLSQIAVSPPPRNPQTVQILSLNLLPMLCRGNQLAVVAIAEPAHHQGLRLGMTRFANVLANNNIKLLWRILEPWASGGPTLRVIRQTGLLLAGLCPACWLKAHAQNHLANFDEAKRRALGIVTIASTGRTVMLPKLGTRSSPTEALAYALCNFSEVSQLWPSTGETRNRAQGPSAGHLWTDRSLWRLAHVWRLIGENRILSTSVASVSRVLFSEEQWRGLETIWGLQWSQPNLGPGEETEPEVCVRFLSVLREITILIGAGAPDHACIPVLHRWISARTSRTGMVPVSLARELFGERAAEALALRREVDGSISVRRNNRFGDLLVQAPSEEEAVCAIAKRGALQTNTRLFVDPPLSQSRIQKLAQALSRFFKNGRTLLIAVSAEESEGWTSLSSLSHDSVLFQQLEHGTEVKRYISQNNLSWIGDCDAHAAKKSEVLALEGSCSWIFAEFVRRAMDAISQGHDAIIDFGDQVRVIKRNSAPISHADRVTAHLLAQKKGLSQITAVGTGPLATLLRLSQRFSPGAIYAVTGSASGVLLIDKEARSYAVASASDQVAPIAEEMAAFLKASMSPLPITWVATEPGLIRRSARVRGVAISVVTQQGRIVAANIGKHLVMLHRDPLVTIAQTLLSQVPVGQKPLFYIRGVEIPAPSPIRCLRFRATLEKRIQFRLQRLLQRTRR